MRIRVEMRIRVGMIRSAGTGAHIQGILVNYLIYLYIKIQHIKFKIVSIFIKV